MKLVASLLTMVCFCSIALADVVTLKNGDRVTGTLVTIKGGNMELKSAILGELTIPMAQIATYSSAKPVAVVRKGKETVKGTMELLPSGNLQVKSNGQEQTLAPANVDLIMPADEYQQKYEGPAPKPWQAWKGTAALGESLQRGNQDSNTLTTTIAAIRERPETVNFERHFRSTFNFATLLSHADEPGSTVTSRTLATGLRQDYLFSSRGFVYGIGLFQHISTEGLYLRQTYGGGLGFQAINNSRETFSIVGGLTYQREHFIAAASDESMDGMFGEIFGRQFNKRMRLDHNLTFYPNFSEGGQYRFDTTTVFSLKLNTRLALNATFIDLYLSNPPAGNQNNNVTFSTGIGLLF